MEMLVYERLPCCSFKLANCKQQQYNLTCDCYYPHTQPGKLLILHRVYSMFNYRHVTTLSRTAQLSHSSLIKTGHLAIIAISYLAFESHSTILMSLRACSDSPSAAQPCRAEPIGQLQQGCWEPLQHSLIASRVISSLAKRRRGLT